jgi:hypothetical protein
MWALVVCESDYRVLKPGIVQLATDDAVGSLI